MHNKPDQEQIEPKSDDQNVSLAKWSAEAAQALPEFLRPLVRGWSPDIERALLDHMGSNDTYRTAMHAVADKLRGMAARPDDDKERLAEYLNELRDVLKAGPREVRSLLPSDGIRESGDFLSVMETGSSVALSRASSRACDAILSRYRFDSYIANRVSSIAPGIEGNDHEEAQEKELREEDESSRGVPLREWFQQVTTVDLAEQSAAALNRFREKVNEAELIQARRLIGVPDNSKITVDAVNCFLRKNVGQDLPAEDKDRLSRLVSHLRQTGAKLILSHDGETIECSLTSYFRKERNSHVMFLREVGGKRRKVWGRTTLPPHLRIDAS